jgi:hypothetical protein
MTEGNHEGLTAIYIAEDMMITVPTPERRDGTALKKILSNAVANTIYHDKSISMTWGQ